MTRFSSLPRRVVSAGACTVLFAALWIGCAGTGSDTGGGGLSPATGGNTTSSTATDTTTSSTTTQTGTGAGGGAGGAGASAGAGGDGGGGGGGAGASGGEGGGGGAPGLPIGGACLDDVDCASNLCRAVLLDTGDKVCVTPCTAQGDCPAGGFYFCEPTFPGSLDGYCIPRSPAHCLSCETNDDCGSLSEECIVAPGDEDLACHVDCAIAGEDACPPEYDCEDITVDNVARRLCRPNVPTCLDAVGGYCDRVSIPQSCERDNAAGICLGQRTCLVNSSRYNLCDADAPQCKATCSAQDPAGCNLIYCPEATAGADNCGSCGNPCPGYGQVTANVSCLNSTTCTFSCVGDNYDVNSSESDGCEVADSPTTNHDQGTATYLGSFSCSDGGSQQSFGGSIPSDHRAHQAPAVVNFNASTGAAPDWFRIYADGGACVNDVNLTLDVNGTGTLTCFRMSVLTSQGTYVCDANAQGICSVSRGSGSYNDNTDIYVRIEKTCAHTTSTGSTTYTVTGHL